MDSTRSDPPPIDAVIAAAVIGWIVVAISFLFYLLTDDHNYLYLALGVCSLPGILFMILVPIFAVIALMIRLCAPPPPAVPKNAEPAGTISSSVEAPPLTIITINTTMTTSTSTTTTEAP